MAGAVAIHRRARRAAAIEKELTIFPCLVLVGNDVVLEIARFLSFPEGGPLSSSVLRLQRRFVFQHLV